MSWAEPTPTLDSRETSWKMYELLKDILGPEYWQGPNPEGPLPIR
jgi:hypothetical protein